MKAQLEETYDALTGKPGSAIELQRGMTGTQNTLARITALLAAVQTLSTGRALPQTTLPAGASASSPASVIHSPGASAPADKSAKNHFDTYAALLQSDPRQAGQYYAQNADAILVDQAAAVRAAKAAQPARAKSAKPHFDMYNQLRNTDARAAGQYYAENADAILNEQAALNRGE